MSARYQKDSGFAPTAPPGISVDMEAGAPLVVKHAAGRLEGALSAEQHACLAGLGWRERVGDGVGVWVSVDEQKLRIIRGGESIWQADCSTAAKGAGCEMDSFKTPLGWHSVAEKVGEGACWGQVFRNRQAANETWRRGDTTAGDLILTRILVLAGEEPGKNKGGNVDSRARHIYVHGTNAGEDIGKATSRGCIRLSNDDVIAAYDRIPLGTLLLITQA